MKLGRVISIKQNLFFGNEDIAWYLLALALEQKSALAAK